MDHVMCLTIYNSYAIATQLLQDITIFKQVSKRKAIRISNGCFKTLHHDLFIT